MPTHPTVVVFDLLVFLSILLGLCTLVPAALSKSVTRSPCWYSFMTAWLVYSLSYVLLVGRQETPDQPPLGLCLTQTILIYAIPVLVVFAMLNLYIELCLILSRLRSGDFGPPKRWKSFWLVITPWLAFITIILEVFLVIVPGGRLHLVRRASTTNFYCHLVEDALPCTISAVIVLALIAIMLPLQAWLAFTMFRSSHALKHLTGADRQLFIALYVRLTLATLCTIVGFGLSLKAVFMISSTVEESLSYPIVAIFIIITFATQKDILRIWLFWRPSRPRSSILFRVSESRETRSEVYLQGTDQDNNHVNGGSNI